ncbi:glycosyltransferase family A protein [Pseudomonas saxonica]|nr:glycosyltransferase family A protein [Pseudomonas saxonica]
MLTVIIPAYNHESYILECLEAVIKINHSELKVIVIDDGSLDRTPQIISDFIGKNSSVCMEYVSKRNSGLVDSLNIGLSKVSAGYLYIVASDDIPCAAGIVECINLLERVPDASFCIGGGVNFFDGDVKEESSIYGSSHAKFFGMKSVDRSIEMFLNYPSPILLQSTIFKVEALKEIGGWDKKLTLDDFPVFIKLLSAYPECNKDFLFRPDINVVKYRQHGLNGHKNMYRHFLMVRESLIALTPSNLKSRALGSAVGFYTLVALKNREIRTAISILFGSGIKVLGLGILKMPVLIFSRAKHYILRESK